MYIVSSGESDLAIDTFNQRQTPDLPSEAFYIY
jgi:hypothetical protein